MTEDFHRTLNQVYEDGLWPDTGIMGPDPEASTRHYAVMVVLRSIPPDDYDKLNDAPFQWFIPHHWAHGMIMPFFVNVTDHPRLAPYAQVLYLSPALEKAKWDIVIATVAHELSHLVAKHKVLVGNEYDDQEQEAWEKARAWGFEPEVKKLLAVNKWRHSYERYIVRRLIAEREST